MLRLLSLASAVFYTANAASDLYVLIGDDDLRGNQNTNQDYKRVKASFRGDDAETAQQEYNVCGCDSGGNGLNLNADCGSVDAYDQDKLADPVGTGNMKTDYNATTGIMTISNRGGYGSAEVQTLQLDGPGTLYTTHLDIEPRNAFLMVQDSDGNDVRLTGNYSACLRTRTGGIDSTSLETTYMDDNLGQGQHSSESNNDYHTTEETHNKQGDLCHDILTGKLLMPAPIDLALGANTLTWTSASHSGDGGADDPGAHGGGADYYEGFELLYQFMDVYTVDVSTTQTHMCISGAASLDPVLLTDNGDGRASGAGSVPGTPPAGTASRVYFTDTDTNKLKIKGNVEVDAEAGSTQTAYTVTLEKFEPAGRWGYILGQLANEDEFSGAQVREDLPYGETTVYGPRDSHGHNGAPFPYYPTGGSTGTEAPKLMGGGPSVARVFNKHGDVIPGSSRGMHPDYQAAEELVDVQAWTCDCSSVCETRHNRRCSVEITRQSGENNGAGLIASQGSPPAPMYQLRVRSCTRTQDANADLHCNMREDKVIQLIDIAEYEPKATFYGDLDPKTRVLQGEITVVSPAYSMGIKGYRAYPTADGINNLALEWSDDTLAQQAGPGEQAKNPQFILSLDKHCPPSDADAATHDAGNTDWVKYCTYPPGHGGPETNADYDAGWCALAQEPCGNDNPYSPKCLGKSCPFINILPGSQGEWYISRYDNNGNQENPQTRLHGAAEDPLLNNEPQMYSSNTAQRNYSHNEHAQIYLPKDGWLTPIMMDVNTANGGTGYQADSVGTNTGGGGAGDSLVLLDAPGNEQANLVTATLSEYIDIVEDQAVIEWKTDEYDTAHGWTLIFQPNYPELALSLGTPMAQGASGLRIVPVYHAYPTTTKLTDSPSDGAASGTATFNDGEQGEACGECTCVGCAVEASTNADTYVETYDWLVPNVTCTPTTMHCPLPTVWAHINYTTPSLYPEPAEGSCLQQKSGTSSLSGCSDKRDMNTRWYSANSPTTSQPGNSLQNTDEEDNAQGVAADTYSRTYTNWAGNCGDASSYFWFEKIACGSSRTFLTDRSLIEDFVQLTPTWEDIQQILDLYYTTKAPLAGRDNNVGFTFITADYHVAPVLPPKVNCTCQSAMDAYASLLSVVSKTPTPGAPVTLDPEVLNTGTSKIVATLRMYQDPTYSIPASSVAALPIVVTRFYLEVSTKFTRNRITISDCSASNVENLLNDTTSLKPRMNYCDNSTFDTKTERSPNGVTHMDRISMKKFKFQTTTDVFVQCKIRACAQQPCGVCSGTGNAYRQLQSDIDLSPVEGEMFAPPVSLSLAHNDPNALVFPDSVAQFQSQGLAGPASIGQATQDNAPPTTKPIMVKSNLVLSSIDASWAIQNREAVTQTLRTTMGVAQNEDLVITSISRLGRELSEKSRSLQSGGVKIDFVIGVSNQARATIASSRVTQLASGSPSLAMQFSSALDNELRRRGQAPINLPSNAMAFAAPQQEANTARPQATEQQLYSASGVNWQQQQQQQQQPLVQQPAAADTGSDRMILGLVIGAFAMGIMGVVMFLHFSKAKANASGHDEEHYEEESPDQYASKVAALEQNWQEADASMDQSAW